MTAPRFASGIVLITPGIEAAFAGRLSLVGDLLARHLTGDWGDLCPADRAANARALQTGARLLSAYSVADGTRVWIITEADRGSSTILLPEEY